MYHLSVRWKFSRLHNSQQITFSTQSCLLLYSYRVSLVHSHITWLTVTSFHPLILLKKITQIRFLFFTSFSFHVEKCHSMEKKRRLNVKYGSFSCFCTGCYYLRSSGRCPWCNDYRRREWTRRHEFKSWTRLIAFHIALIPLGKVWIQIFSLQLRVNSRAD